MLSPTVDKPKVQYGLVAAWLQAGMPTFGDTRDGLDAVCTPAEVERLTAAAADVHELTAASIEGDADAVAALRPAYERLFSVIRRLQQKSWDDVQKKLHRFIDASAPRVDVVVAMPVVRVAHDRETRRAPAARRRRTTCTTVGSS